MEREPQELLVGLDDETYRKLLDAAPDALVVVDADGRIVFANEQTVRTFGYAPDQLVGQPIEVLIPERYHTTHVVHRTSYMASPRVRSMGSGLELSGRRCDGSELPIEISLSPLVTPSRRLACAAIRDITERKLLEARARRTDELLRNAVEAVQGAFSVFDKDDRLVLCNSSYRVWFAADVAALIGRRFEELLDAFLDTGILDLGDEPPAAFRARRLAYHRSPEGSLDVRTSDGRVIRLSERRTSDGGCVSITWDMTSDVERERELQRAREKAEAASTAKSEFLSSMSHELRTPLNSVLGFAQLLERDRKDPVTERQRERLGYVVSGGEHLLRLIDDVLDLSRIEAGRLTLSPEPVEIAAVIAQVIETLRPMAARAGITIESASISDPRARVLADRTRFSQVLMNYGTNAVKYGKAGGAVRFAMSADTGHVRVTVTDDGPGIPPSAQADLFKPFHRAGQETGPIEGTGIGLAICKRLAEAMRGSVGFESRAGEGTAFWIELPTAAPATGIATTPAPRRMGTLPDDGEQRTILYVEDNPANIAFVESFVQDLERIRLLTAPSAEIGIELARAERPSVVLMDVNLPGMSGIEAVRRLRAWPETRDIPVVALSAAAMPEDAKRASKAGFYRYLTKPVDVDELSAVLEEILSER